MSFAAVRRLPPPVHTHGFTTGTGGTWPDGITVGNALRIDQYDPTFHMLNDGSAVFYRVLSMLRKGETLFQPRFNWFEDDIQTNATGVLATQGGTGAADAITVDDPQMVHVNSKLINMTTGEHILVRTVNAAGVLTSTRGASGTTAAAWTEGDRVVVVGPMLPEGGAPQDGRSHLPEEKSNWVAFYSTTQSISDVQSFSKMLNDVGSLDDQIRKAMIRVMRMIDQDLRLSRRHATTPDVSQPQDDRRIYTFDGLEAQVTQREDLLAGSTWLEMCDLFNPYFRATGSSPRKTLLCGPTMFAEFTRLMDNRHNFVPQFEPTIGAQVAGVQLSEGGQIELVNDIHGMAAAFGTDARGYLLDMPFIEMREFNGMGLQVKDVTNPNSHHTESREIFGSATLQVKHGDSLHAVVNMA